MMISLISCSILTLVFLFTLSLFLRRESPKNIPPGPPSLPLIGNLHQLKKPLHHTFHRISQRYGPIFSLRFGTQLVVVVSSPSAVQECFTKNDIVLANRPRFLTGKYLGYNYTNIAFAPYGDHWRNLRRITVVELLSTHRLNKFSEIRRDEINRLVQKLAQESYDGFAKVEMRSRFSEMTFNIIMRMISGKRYSKEEGAEFRGIIKELAMVGGASNPGEFLPLIRWFDLDGLDRKLKKFYKRVDGFLQGLIDEHRNGSQSGDTMIDHLLTMQQSQPEYYSDEIIKGHIWVMIFAGTDTTAVTLEWALSRLLNHPNILKKAIEEIDTHFGKECLIDETNISNLLYLQSIVFEILRLHPATPLLVPHFSSDDCTIEGYNIPANTIVLINAWAIHRDPQLWTDTTSFKPERFEKKDEANKLIPFGLGRRACPGSSLAQRIVWLTLSLLIQCFEWKHINKEEVDIEEGEGLTMSKIIPLTVMCKVRHSVINDVISLSPTNN